MSRVSSGEKRSEWLDRFADSKLTVGEFCRQERVSDASFYHWRKRTRLLMFGRRSLALSCRFMHRPRL